MNDSFQKIDSLFCEYYSPDLQRPDVYGAFTKLMMDCFLFKLKIERQESEYLFRRSKSGETFCQSMMNSVNFNDSEDNLVQMSVWPSMYKVSFDHEELLLEPEIVWTQKPIDLDTTDKEQSFGFQPEIEDDCAS